MHTDAHRLAVFIIAYQQPLTGSASLLRLLNETIANLTGLDASKHPEEAHRYLTLMALVLRLDQAALDGVAKQRLIFLVKHVVPWLSQTLASSLKAELCKTLTMILPHIAEVYSEDWESILEYLATSWMDARQLNPATDGSGTIALWHASLKLFATLRSLTQDEDTNDDLKEAWTEKLDGLAQGLKNLLQQSAPSNDGTNLPLRATNEVLARQIKAVPATKLGDTSGLYALLDTESREIQQTAFDILHRQIPQEAEQISVNVALEKSVARLPDELLSLITQTPDPELYDDLAYERTMPSPLFAYLSSWLLVFDHFGKASHKVRSDYVAHLKEQAANGTLLNLIFVSLGHSRSKPIDASKFDPTFYSFNIESDPKRNIQW